MPKKLSDTEIAKRLRELRNLRKLHATDQKTKAELRSRIKALETDNAELRMQLATQAIQIAELQTMVFGRKKRPPGGTPPSKDDQLKPEPKTRDKNSYRRPTPQSSAITSEVATPLPDTCSCGGSFRSITTHDRYQEDIPLPELTKDYAAHLATKYIVQRGVCQACGKATSGRDLGGAEVALGPNVRLLITHLITVVGLSYSQTTNLLLGLYGLAVSDGEIANTIRKQHQAWLPAYEQLKADIRAAPIRHYDETPWKIQASDNTGSAWVMADAGSNSTVFHLATSRGAPHAQMLHGVPTNQESASNLREHVYVTDDYGAYRNLDGYQQLCWAHLYRTIRDLRYNQGLPKEHQPYVLEWYGGFASIYQDLRTYLDQPYDEATRIAQATELWGRVQTLASQAAPKAGEPDKLRRLKAQLLRAGADRLFICLPKDTPCDNNRAERDLRQLVLKRKRSFGSKTEQGAKALSTVLSICTTTWRSNQQGYFKALAAVGV